MEFIEDHLLFVDVGVLVVVIVLDEIGIYKIIIVVLVFLLPFLALDKKGVHIMQIIFEQPHDLEHLSSPLNNTEVLELD